MFISFVYDADTGRPHVERHGVTIAEVEQVLYRSKQDQPGRDGTREAIGPTDNGRVLKVIYRRLGRDAVKVITAYPLGGNAIKSYQRRKRRRS